MDTRQPASRVRLALLTGALMASALVVGCASSVEPGSQALTDLPELITVPSGSFRMGYGNEQSPAGPEHTVVLSRDFGMGKYEVTNEEYCAALNYALGHDMLAGDYKRNRTVANNDAESHELLKLDGTAAGKTCAIRYDAGERAFVVESGFERLPVTFVTWWGSAYYCHLLSLSQGLESWYDVTQPEWPLLAAPGSAREGYRLPTEAEWEYAGRYDDGRTYPWGAEEGDATRANYNGSTEGATEVGSYPLGATKLGIMDMAGNVSEWCQDYFSSYNVLIEHYTGVDPRDDPTAPVPALTDPVNDFSGVYLQRRGGGWLPYANNYLWLPYHTDTNYAYIWYPDLGFRVVKTQ